MSGHYGEPLRSPLPPRLRLGYQGVIAVFIVAIGAAVACTTWLSQFV